MQVGGAFVALQAGALDGLAVQLDHAVEAGVAAQRHFQVARRPAFRFVEHIVLLLALQGQRKREHARAGRGQHGRSVEQQRQQRGRKAGRQLRAVPAWQRRLGQYIFDRGDLLSVTARFIVGGDQRQHRRQLPGPRQQRRRFANQHALAVKHGQHGLRIGIADPGQRLAVQAAMAVDQAKGDHGAALVEQDGAPFAALVAVVHGSEQLAPVRQHVAGGIAPFADRFERLLQQQRVVIGIAAARIAEKLEQRRAHLRLFAQARQLPGRQHDGPGHDGPGRDRRRLDGGRRCGFGRRKHRHGRAGSP